MPGHWARNLWETLTGIFGKEEGATTSSSFDNVVELKSDNPRDYFNEVSALHVNKNVNGNPTQARILQANRPDLDPSNAPTSDDITGNADWETVAESGTVSSGNYWPSLSGSGYEVHSDVIVMQDKDEGSAEETDNYMTGDKEK